MWREIANRLLIRKRSYSVQEMADILFGLTVGVTPDDSFIEQVNLASVAGLDLEIAKIEAVFLRYAAVCNGLLSSETVRKLHGSKIDEVELLYVRHFTERLRHLQPQVGEGLLGILQTRVSAYTKALELWFEAHRNGRGHEQAFAISTLFFGFCGVQCTNPVTLHLVDHYFHLVVKQIFEILGTCKLT